MIMTKNKVTEENTSADRLSRKEAAWNALQIEKEDHVFQSEKRFDTFSNILFNNSIDKVSPKYALYAFLGILPALSSKWIYTLIPVHNVVEDPSYWYELPFQLMFGYLLIWVTYGTFASSYFMNIVYIRKLRHIAILWFIMALLTLTFFGCLYLVWEDLLHLRYPVPLMGYIYLVISIFGILIALCFRFPLPWLKHQCFRKRLAWFCVAFFLAQIIYVEYAFLTKLLLSLPQHFLWIPALALPIVREANTWLQTKMFLKASDGDPSGVEIMCGHGVCLTHSFFLAYTIGTLATTEFSAVTIAVDFMINFLICLRVIYLKKKNQTRENIKKQIELLQILVINETNEFIAPLCYILCFMTAYFGPNSRLIGNMGNSYWQYHKIENVEQSIEFVFIFMFIDLGSLVVVSILLWRLFRINLYRAFSVLQNEFCVGFSASLAVAFNAVRIVICIFLPTPLPNSSNIEV